MEKEKFSILVSSPLDSGYVQNLSFKAGFHWKNMEQKPKYTNAKQLFFHPDKTMAQGSSDNDSYLDTKTDYSFPKDAVKIHELFNTPEYKVGDYVVLVEERSEFWSHDGDMDKYLKSTQCITEFFKASGEYGQEVSFELKPTKEWWFKLQDIARHATEEEIKAYKGEGDIYIGEHKVE